MSDLLKTEIITLKEDVTSSTLYSDELAPISESGRTWNTLHLASIWVGMAVCIPTYLMASYMIRAGLSWFEALIIISLANLIITVPMILNGHAGVKYGIPFPVLGRASFGTKGIHLASILRAVVACGWFGVQTWIGGLAIYAIFIALTGGDSASGFSIGKFLSFIVFWFINIYFVWKGTESIKWLEEFSAPILLLIGVFLIGWGVTKADGFVIVLEQSKQLQHSTAQLEERAGQLYLTIDPLTDKTGSTFKADEFQLIIRSDNEELDQNWLPIATNLNTNISDLVSVREVQSGEKTLSVTFRKHNGESPVLSSAVELTLAEAGDTPIVQKIWVYILWLTAMVGFWATMSLSIADITRFAKTQTSQVAGQFIGLPGTMILYSFVGIFVTCAAIINFDSILIGEDAPWDPVTLLSMFESPSVVIVSQIFMLIATLSTNIAANVIAPANAFSNLFPKKISFRAGGVITGIIGIVICPWLWLDDISSLLIFISGLLGPVLGIMLADYFVVRKKHIYLAELYKDKGLYSYKGSGFNPSAMIAFSAGTGLALIGYWVEALNFFYSLSWFTGFFLAFGLYYFLMKGKTIDPEPIVANV
ncbi:MAG: NCS1 family nucleobase:cation symporter-1 [Balneolaceae bacterium]|nr:NCS1 family nucleobase:cation symporter-1 [Balneolaceae bacterium]MBO6546788.1 NCS1 family nucleobase:cation symporter-1 [Balneolaceae bacterium]MBO6649148.1 NCS1 family nucleobase:cation symporter-1 [Balneolaceae bacterium]